MDIDKTIKGKYAVMGSSIGVMALVWYFGFLILDAYLTAIGNATIASTLEGLFAGLGVFVELGIPAFLAFVAIVCLIVGFIKAMQNEK
jgi:hypothetical protein